MITFKEVERVQPRHECMVYLDGKRVGDIYSNSGGFRYIPIKGKTSGDYYPTLSLCKLSLEDISE